MVGVFYPYFNDTAWMNWDMWGESYPIPNAQPYLKPGDLVTPETVIGVMSSMGSCFEIDAMAEGVFCEYLVPERTWVEWHQPLACIRITHPPLNVTLPVAEVASPQSASSANAVTADILRTIP